MQSMATIKLDEGDELMTEAERSFSGPPKFPGTGMGASGKKAKGALVEE